MVKREIVKEKVDRILFNLNRIQKFQNIDYDQFISDYDTQDIVIHNLFLIVQNLIDIGNHIIADEGLESPGYYGEIPEILAKEKIISENLALFSKR